MNKENQIQDYLSELKQALDGQPAGLVQDALYDAESHLLDANHDGECTNLSDVIANYGHPQDIASYYVQLEKDNQLLINGPDETKPRFNGFFEPLFCLSDFKALGYFFIAFPLSIVYFAGIALVGVPALLLSIIAVGLPFLALFLKVQSQLALIEGNLISTLLGVRMPRRPARSLPRRQEKLKLTRAIGNIIKSPHGWKSALYSAIHLPLSATYFCLGSTLFIASFALMITPVLDPIVHHFHPHLSVDLQWYWLPVTSVIGLIGMTLALYVTRALTKLHSAIASALLIDH